MKKEIILIITCIFLVLGLTGCSRKPVYYSKKEVTRYVEDVHSENCKLKEEKSYPDASNEGNPVYEYVFETENGMSFSVYSYTRHPTMDASTTSFYKKQIGDNYLSSVMALHRDEIEKICQAGSVNYALKEYDNKNTFNICLYLDNYKQLDEAAQTICNIDQLISFEYDYSNYFTYNPVETIGVYLRPDNYEEVENWKSSWRYEIDCVDLSNSQTNRLDKESVVEILEAKLARRIIGGNTYYSIPDEILNKYAPE